MKGRFLVVLFAAGYFGAAGAGETPSTFFFATQERGRAVLEARDDFVMRLSPFDRAARLKTDKEVSERQYLEFVGKNVLSWQEGAQKHRVLQALAYVEARLKNLAVPLPGEVFLIRTTGREEGGAPYTRANAIILPENVLSDSTQNLVKVISHEIFHVLSRSNPTLRTALYKVIGFEPCPEFVFPGGLAIRKITNPDAPRNEHRIKVTYRGRSVWAVPVHFASVDRYDPKKGGEFFNYLEFRLALTNDDGSESEPDRFAEVGEVKGFFEQVGRNTDYIIHPEEILADNFALLTLEESPLPSPAVPAAILRVLKEAGRAQPAVPADAASPRG